MNVYTDTARARFRSSIKATRNGQLCTVNLEIPVYYRRGSEEPICVYRRISRASRHVTYADMVQYTRETGESRDYESGNHALVGEIFRSLKVTLNYRWDARLLDAVVSRIEMEERAGYQRALEESWLSRQQSQRGFEGQQLSLFPS